MLLWCNSPQKSLYKEKHSAYFSKKTHLIDKILFFPMWEHICVIYIYIFRLSCSSCPFIPLTFPQKRFGKVLGIFICPFNYFLHSEEKMVLSIPSTALTLWQLLAMEEMSPGQRGPGHGTLGTAPSQGGLTQFLVSHFKHKWGHNLYRPLPHKCNHQSKNLLEPVLSLAGKGQERQLHPRYRSSITPWFIYATPSLTA